MDGEKGVAHGRGVGIHEQVWGKAKAKTEIAFHKWGATQLVARRAEKKSRNLIQCELFISCQIGAVAWIIPHI